MSTKYGFKRKLEDLNKYTGRATELISLYIPPDRRIADVTNYLKQELAESSNIKSKSTRKNVLSSIMSILNRVKTLRKPPPNGIAFFVGYSTAENTPKQIREAVEPPEPIQTFLYRCDSSFYLQPLFEMTREKEKYGLLVIDRNEATLGILKGKRIEPIKHIVSRVPSKHSKGGQSQRRFERLIEQAAHDYFKKVGDLATQQFLHEELEGMLIGGPGATKNTFLEKDYLHHQIKKKVLGTFNTGYTTEYGLRELIEQSAKKLSQLSLVKERKLLEKFMKRCVKGGLATYGKKDVIVALERGAVELLLVSDGIKDKALVDQLLTKANQTSTGVEIISLDSSEGEMFMRAFSGIGALLRYEL